MNYPFITSYVFKDIKNNGIIKCIYRKMRINNRIILDESFKKYKDICKGSETYDENNSENTLIDTENNE